jgi:hypothetical protein
LLLGLGFVASNKSKTLGSRVRFQNSDINVIIDVHKPHTKGAPIKETALRNICIKLIDNNLIQ